MKTMTLPNTELTVSALCMGCMQCPSKVQGEAADELFNAFRDAGGNFFDTAHCYCFWTPLGDGASERALGDYVARTCRRDEVVIATKGGHPSAENYRKVDRYLSPGRIAADIDDSLARLKTDCIDLFWLHRDDTREEVGTIVDILNGEVTRGRIRHFGGSNWTAGRLAEANAYAADHGVQGFCASEPRWHLACGDAEPAGEKRREPGVLLALSREDEAIHRRSGLPVIPYSPTANGFFATGGGKRERLRTEANLARLARAEKLAEQLGATPNQVALAWLMGHDFPVIPILGTSNLEHLRDALGSVEVELSPDQVRWLRDGEDA